MPLSLSISAQSGNPVYRSYKNPTEYKHWDKFVGLCSDADQMEEIRKAWQDVLPFEFTRSISQSGFADIFGTTESEVATKYAIQLPVDWHLDYIVHEHLKQLKTNGKLTFRTNAFRNYRALEILEDGKLRCPPFFGLISSRLEAENDPLRFEKMKRGLQDSNLFLAEPLSIIFSNANLKEEERGKILTRLFSWFEITLTITKSSAVNGNEFTLDLAHETWRSGSGWTQQCDTSINHKVWTLPNPKTNEKPTTILLSSPNVRDCVGRLSVAWQNIEIRKILLLAPPGSGKEVLVDLFRTARMIPKDWKAEIIGTDLKDPRKLSAQLAKLRRHLRKDLSKDWRRPILEVDEIHQASIDERASLLRVLETNKFRFDDKTTEADTKQLIWLFEASETRVELLNNRGPRDFWTRMDQIIDMVHPLAFLDPEDGVGDTRRRVLADYFWLYWRGLEEKPDDIKNEQDEVRKQILEVLLSAEAFKLADKFAESVGSPLVELFSVRYIRGMAKRIKGEAVLFGLQNRPLKSTFLEDAQEKMTNWTITAFKDMVLTKRTNDSMTND